MAKKIKIDNDLYLKLAQRAAETGYTDAGEFIVDLLEKAVAGQEADRDRDAAIEKLKGLGYLG